MSHYHQSSDFEIFRFEELEAAVTMNQCIDKLSTLMRWKSVLSVERRVASTVDFSIDAITTLKHVAFASAKSELLDFTINCVFTDVAWMTFDRFNMALGIIFIHWIFFDRRLPNQ